jgi:hypothetical protein
MSEFTRHATAELSTQMRLAMTLAGDCSEKALTTAVAGKITRERIRYATGELAAMNVDNVHRWLADVAQQSPAKAIELFIEILRFSLPQLKALALDVHSSDGSVQTLNYQELEARVISEQ